jgi:hypothetical protein
MSAHHEQNEQNIIKYAQGSYTQGFMQYTVLVTQPAKLFQGSKNPQDGVFAGAVLAQPTNAILLGDTSTIQISIASKAARMARTFFQWMSNWSFFSASHSAHISSEKMGGASRYAPAKSSTKGTSNDTHFDHAQGVIAANELGNVKIQNLGDANLGEALIHGKLAAIRIFRAMDFNSRLPGAALVFRDKNDAVNSEAETPRGFFPCSFCAARSSSLALY